MKCIDLAKELDGILVASKELLGHLIILGGAEIYSFEKTLSMIKEICALSIEHPNIASHVIKRQILADIYSDLKFLEPDTTQKNGKILPFYPHTLNRK